MAGQTQRPDTMRRGLSRRLLMGGAVGGLGTAAAALWPWRHARASDEIRFFRIGTGTIGGTYFPVGGLIASAISKPPGSPPCTRGGGCGVPGLIAVAQATSGSVENIRLLREGQFNAALCQADVAFWAHTGSALFHESEAYTGLRAVGQLYAEVVHVVVRADSAIFAIDHLAGRRVSLGGTGSGTRLTARVVLEGYGLTEADMESVPALPEEAAQLLEQDEIDAFFVVGGAPVLTVGDLARRLPIRLVNMTGPDSVPLIAGQPYLSRAHLPGGVYSGVPATRTVSVGALLCVNDRLDADIAYGVTEALWHPTSAELFASGHPRGTEIVLDQALRSISIPLHAGAQRFYHALGMVDESGRPLKPTPDLEGVDQPAAGAEAAASDGAAETASESNTTEAAPNGAPDAGAPPSSAPAPRRPIPPAGSPTGSPANSPANSPALPTARPLAPPQT